MRRLFLLALACFTVGGSFGVAVPVPDPVLNAMLGDWTATSFHHDGGDMHVRDQPTKLRITDDTLTLTVFPQRALVCSYKIDTSRDPARIDIELAQGKEKGMRSLGIIHCEGDVLKLTFRHTRHPRPESFKLHEERQTSIYIFKRDQPAKGKP